MTKPKQVIVIRKDLNMRMGKVAAQVGHAILKACFSFAQFVKTEEKEEIVLDITQEDINTWWKQEFTKIVCYVNSEQELIDLYEQAKEASLPCSLIKDAGHTEFHGVPTLTAMAVGPAKAELVDLITGNLPLL